MFTIRHAVRVGSFYYYALTGHTADRGEDIQVVVCLQGEQKLEFCFACLCNLVISLDESTSSLFYIYNILYILQVMWGIAQFL